MEFICIYTHTVSVPDPPVSSSLSELKEAQRRQQQREDRFRQEEVIANATLVWNQNILPHWDSMYDGRHQSVTSWS